MTYSIELFSLKSISVPNLVSIAQIFLEPADPLGIPRQKFCKFWYQCTKFRVASSKFPESKAAYPNSQCMCIARAPCTQSPNGMHHRITLIELHQCTKFGVDSSKIPKTGGPLSNKLIRSWRAHPASYRNGNHKDI